MNESHHATSTFHKYTATITILPYMDSEKERPPLLQSGRRLIPGPLLLQSRTSGFQLIEHFLECEHTFRQLLGHGLPARR